MLGDVEIVLASFELDLLWFPFISLIIFKRISMKSSKVIELFYDPIIS